MGREGGVREGARPHIHVATVSVFCLLTGPQHYWTYKAKASCLTSSWESEEEEREQGSPESECAINCFRSSTFEKCFG